MKKILSILLLTIILVSCKKDPEEGSISLKISHSVADKDFKFNDEIYISPTGHPYQITKLTYYISYVSFFTTDGKVQNFDKGYLINLTEGNNSQISFENIEPGKYNKVKFQFGFTKAKNILNYLENTLENQNMYWFSPVDSMAYHYMKLEGKYDSLDMGISKSFKYHFGPTNGNDNSFEVTIDIPEFNVDDNSFQTVIDMDLQEWFKNPTDYNFPEYMMVMMNQNTQEIYNANGKNVFSFKEIIKNE